MFVVETTLQRKSQIPCLTDTRNTMKKVFKYMLSNYVKSLFTCISQSRNYISDKVLGLRKVARARLTVCLSKLSAQSRFMSK